MTYVPNKPTALLPDLSGDAPAYELVLDNADEAYIDYNPPIFGPALVALEANTTSDVWLFECLLPENVDQVPIYCRIWWRGTTGYTATVTFEINDGGTSDTDTDTSTSTSFAWSTLTVTPSTRNAPRYARLYLRQSTAGQLAQIASVTIGYAATTFPAGVLESGAAKFGGAWDVAATPVPREVIGRAHNNLRAVARDRPAGIAGGASGALIGTPPAGPFYEMSESAWTLVERWIQPYSDEGRRTYMLALLLKEGADVEARMVIGPHTWEVAGYGWHVSFPELSLVEGMRCALFLRDTGAADCAVQAWQVMRAPPVVTYPAVSACYSSPAAVGDYLTVDDFGLLFDGSGVAPVAFSFWVRSTAASSIDGNVLWAGDDTTPFLAVAYAGGEFSATLSDDDGGSDGAEEIITPKDTDGDWHHVFVTSRAQSPQHDVLGVQIWYDGESVGDGFSCDPGTVFATATSLLTLLAKHDGSTRFAGKIASVAIFTALPYHADLGGGDYDMASEIEALYAAGRTHDVRNATGRWRARVPAVYYRDYDTAGVVANVGYDTSVGGLTLHGDVVSEAL